MAKTCLIVKAARAHEAAAAAKKREKESKGAVPAAFTTRAYSRCSRCGRPRSVIRTLGLCRRCFRELALSGQIPGVTKSSW